MLHIFTKRKTVPDRAGDLRAEGDAARDRLHWKEAANAYRLFLAERPKAGGIWVQFGNALKESGDLAGAERAYAEAIHLAPRDSDARLQMGHLYKVMSRDGEALLSYELAYFLDPASMSARDEALSTRKRMGTALLDHVRDLASRQPPSEVQFHEARSAEGQSGESKSGHQEATAALEGRLGALAAQMDHILGHVAITKALGAELARLSRRVEQASTAATGQAGR